MQFTFKRFKMYGEFAIHFVDKRSFVNPIKQWQEFNTSAALRGEAEAPTEELLDNLAERHMSYTAPLLITQSATYWSDWVVMKRSTEGRASVVLAYLMRWQDRPGAF